MFGISPLAGRSTASGGNGSYREQSDCHKLDQMIKIKFIVYGRLNGGIALI